MSLRVLYNDEGAAGQPSPNVWGDCPVEKALIAPELLGYVFDDFTSPVATDSSVPLWALTGTNADVDNVADVADGQILLEGSGADNDSATIAKNDMYLLTMNSGKRFWFEASVKLSAAGAADDFACFVGLIESAGATAEMIADDGASIIDENFVGFQAISNATTIQDWDAVINQGGSANFPATVLADASTKSTAYVKLGIKFDGKKTLYFYADGAQVATYDIDNLDNDTMDKEMTIAIGVKDCEAAQLGLYVDWARFAYDKVANGR